MPALEEPLLSAQAVYTSASIWALKHMSVITFPYVFNTDLIQRYTMEPFNLVSRGATFYMSTKF